MVHRGQSRPRSRSRQFGYPLSFRGQVRGAQRLLPCFPPTALVPWRLPSLARVLVSPVPRGHRYDEGATTSRSRIPAAYLFRVRGPHDSSLFVLASSALPVGGGPTQAGTLVQPAVPLPARSRVDANGISQVPRRSIPCLCPGPRPRPDRRRLTMPAPPILPPQNHCEGSSDTNIEATHAASASAAYASRTALPPSRQGSLPTGWLAFAGRESNPLDHSERFQRVTSCSSPSPGLFLSQGSCNRRSSSRASWSRILVLLPVLGRLLLPIRRRLVAFDGRVLLAGIALLRRRHNAGVHHLPRAM